VSRPVASFDRRRPLADHPLPGQTPTAVVAPVAFPALFSGASQVQMQRADAETNAGRFDTARALYDEVVVAVLELFEPFGSLGEVTVVFRFEDEGRGVDAPLPERAARVAARSSALAYSQ